MSAVTRAAALPASLPTLIAATAGVSLLAALWSCSSDSSSAMDETAPAAASFVQDRETDPSGRTIAVAFDESVTPETAAVASSYTISGGVNVTSATLRSAGNVVELALDAPAVPGDNTIAIAAGIEDTAGNVSVAVPPTALASTDTVAPEASAIEGITVCGAENDMIKVVFSDDLIQSEIEVVANWAVEAPAGSSFDITGSTVSYDVLARTATVTLGVDSADQNLQTFDDIQASFTGVRDLGGNTIAATAFGTTAVSGMIGGDTTPPELMAAAPGPGPGADLVLTFSETVTRLETPDLRNAANVNGTDIVLTDTSDPGMAAMGTIALTDTVADGDTVTLSDGTTSFTFEFDIGATGSIELTGQPSDGSTVSIDDGTRTTTFEFEDANGVTSPNVAVLLGGTFSETAGNLVTAINNDPLRVTASAGSPAGSVSLLNSFSSDAGNEPIAEFDPADVIGGIVKSCVLEFC